MSILRLLTLSLTLAIVIFSLGYVDTAFAAPPEPCATDDERKKCKPKPGDDPSGRTYTVDLVGPELGNPGVRGAFEFDIAGLPFSAAPATLDRGALKGAGVVTMTRPGDGSADEVWDDVFNLCGLLGPFVVLDPDPDDGSAPTNLNTFTVESGDWEISEGGGRRWLSFEFTIDQMFSDATDRDLSASLQLTSPCIVDPENNPSCDLDPLLIPTVAGESSSTELYEARIHLRGKGGVTHNAVCHADDDSLSTSFSTMVITAN